MRTRTSNFKFNGETHRRNLAFIYRNESKEYVRDRFFNLTDPQFQKFIRFYGSKYGVSARNYLLNTYYSWKSGATNMSGQTETRLLSCIPKVLSEDEQIRLLRFNLKFFTKLDFKDHKPVSFSKLASAYHESTEYIKSRNISLDWFVKDIFTEEEMQKFISIFRFLLLKRLEISFVSVCNDFKTIKQLVDQASIPVSIYYNISFLNRDITLDSYSIPSFNSFKIDEDLPDFFKSQSSLLMEFVSQDAIEMQKDQSQSRINALISSNDVKLALDQVAGFTQEVDFQMEANGQGGFIKLHFIRKDIKRINYDLQKKGWLLAAYSFLILSIYFHGASNGYLSNLLFPFGIFFLLIFIFLWTSLNNTKKEIEEYERKKAVRFTES